eukprot:1690385-Rhodomonas_salina.1
MPNTTCTANFRSCRFQAVFQHQAVHGWDKKLESYEALLLRDLNLLSLACGIEQPSPTPESLFEEYEDDGEAQKISNSAETSTRSRSRSPNARSPYIDTSKTLVSPIPERRKAVAKSKAQDHERDLKDVTESTESLPASPQVESRTRDSGRGASPGKKTAVRKIK